MNFKPYGIASGYKGQRYEVRALRPQHDVPAGLATEPFVVGWTDQEDGGSLVRMVEKHPSWRSAKVVDLGEDMWQREPTCDGCRPVAKRKT